MSWRRIRLLIWKEFTQLRRDRSMLPILFIMPIMMLLMFGYVVGSDIKNLKLAVLDNDHSIQSQRVVDAFVNSSYFTIAARPQTEAQLKEVLDGSQAVIAIDIPKWLGDAVREHHSAQIGVVVDGSDSRTSQVALQYSNGIVSGLSAEFFPQPGGASAGGSTSKRESSTTPRCGP